MKEKISVVFFGSFQHYSTLILEALVENKGVDVVGVVTTPPRVRRGTDEVLKTHVQQWAEDHELEVFTPERLNDEALEHLPPTDYFVVAGYGKILPHNWLVFPKIKPINVHFSLLPKYRGANPAEWALLLGERETGVSFIEMSNKLDGGKLIAQSPMEILANETRVSLYEKLYKRGAELVGEVLQADKEGPEIPSLNKEKMVFFSPPKEQGDSPTPYARLLKRDDGYISWDLVEKAMSGELKVYDFAESSPLFNTIVQYTKDDPSEIIKRASRALYGYPTLWTRVKTVKGERRMKILECSVLNGKIQLDKVQISGYEAASWKQMQTLITG